MSAPQPPTASPSAGELRALATEIALEAGEMIRTRLGAAHTIDTKASDLDLVTEVDRASEALIVQRILTARPNDGILGEEGSSVAGSSGVEWVIDPIDGTTSFVYGLPGFSVSIAVRLGGDTVAAAVHAPVIDSTYAAAAGQGTTFDGRPATCSDLTDISKALVGTGFSPVHERRRRQSEDIAAILPRIRDIRRMGSAALDLAAVATGQLDAYFEMGLSEWDWAAGELLLREAGARVTVERQGDTGRAFIAAAGPGIADSFFAMLDEVGARSV